MRRTHGSIAEIWENRSRAGQGLRATLPSAGSFTRFSYVLRVWCETETGILVLLLINIGLHTNFGDSRTSECKHNP